MKKVRLSDYDLNAIISLFGKYFSSEDRLWVFGSRVDMNQRGGDIDLYVETQAKTAVEAMKMKTDFLWDLELKIGEQKIDLVLNMVNNTYKLPIYEIAKTKGVRIV